MRPLPAPNPDFARSALLIQLRFAFFLLLPRLVRLSRTSHRVFYFLRTFFTCPDSTRLARAFAAKCARLRQALTASISEVKCSVGAGVQRYAARPLIVLVWSLQQVAPISSQGQPHSTMPTIQVPATARALSNKQ